MDKLTALTRGTQLMLAAGLLLLIDTFLRWQEVSASVAGVEVVSFGRNAWHGFWGILMCLVLIALLAWLIARLADVKISLPVSDVLVAAALAGLLFLFALLKNLVDDYSTIWSYIGVVLAALVAVGAWLEVQAAGGVDALTNEVSGMRSRETAATTAPTTDPYTPSSATTPGSPSAPPPTSAPPSTAPPPSTTPPPSSDEPT